MSTSGKGGGSGLLSPLRSFHRAVVRGGIGLQRDLAETVLAHVNGSENVRRRARLSSHYLAVRMVDQLETAHPDEDASLDPLYDGVGRTFEVLTDLDDRATDTAVGAVETTQDVAEDVGERYLEASESTCGPLVDLLDEPTAADGIDVTVDAPADD
jgi:hypothetical protein